MSESRYFTNSYADFSPDKPNLCRNESNLNDRLMKLVQEIEKSIENGAFPLDDSSVYTGLAGVALLHYFLWKKTGNSAHLQSADRFIQNCDTSNNRYVSFLCGGAGPLCLDAVIAYKRGQTRRMEDSVKKLQHLLKNALSDEKDELLFGRSGYLYALLFTRHELGPENASLFLTEIETVCKKILDSGRQFAQVEFAKDGPPLMWQWHGKMYLGAAHGVAGIIHTLLLAHPFSQSVRESVQGELQESLTWLKDQRYPNSGNWLSSVGSSSSDKLVQWCHGASAMPHVFLKFNEIFPKNEFVKAALEACEVVWQRGLLTKGYGICHGAAGNAYSFLSAYKVTSDPRHLYRALKFAEWCCEPEKRHLARQPDRPFSLFEGSAGTAWFLADMCFGDLKATTFPAYELFSQ